jgi:GNAT superfamily N-acetyltransferase
VQIDFLADRPDDLETLVVPMFEYWQRVFTDDTLAARRERLRGHLNRSELPVAWVAHDKGTVLGTAALRANDLPEYPKLTPWLSGVFVLPAHTNRGVGSALCRHVEVQAAQMGYSRLYLFTLDRQSLYGRLGWRLLCKGTWQGLSADVMSKTIP